MGFALSGRKGLTWNSKEGRNRLKLGNFPSNCLSWRNLCKLTYILNRIWDYVLRKQGARNVKGENSC
jgi:hypothetical protein